MLFYHLLNYYLFLFLIFITKDSKQIDNLIDSIYNNFSKMFLVHFILLLYEDLIYDIYLVLL